MKIVAYIVGGLLAIAAFFGFLEWLTRRNYKPNVQYVVDRILETIDGTMGWQLLDEFECVPIHYYPALEQLRLRFVEIINDPSNLADDSNPVALRFNEKGVSLLTDLVVEVRRLPDIETDKTPDAT